MNNEQFLTAIGMLVETTNDYEGIIIDAIIDYNTIDVKCICDLYNASDTIATQHYCFDRGNTMEEAIEVINHIKEDIANYTQS